MTTLCGNEIPDSEFVNRVPSDNDSSVSRSDMECTVTVKIVDVDADQKINVTEVLDYFDGDTVDESHQEDDSVLVTVKILPDSVTWDPKAATIITHIIQEEPDMEDLCAYPCCLKITIDGKFMLWSFSHKDFYSPFTASPVPMTQEEWDAAVSHYADLHNGFEILYCTVETESAVKRATSKTMGDGYDDPDFGLWAGPIYLWPCVSNSGPPNFPEGSCWRRYEDNAYGDMSASYIDEGEVCEPIEGGIHCTYYFAGVLEHDLEDIQQDSYNFGNIVLDGVLEHKLHRKITDSSHPDHPGTVVDYCETYKRIKRSEAEEVMVCLAPGEVTSDIHPLFSERNPKVGTYKIFENLSSEYFTENTVTEFTSYDVGVRTALNFGGDLDFSGSENIDASAYIFGEGSLGLAYLFESYHVHDGTEYLAKGIKLLAFNNGTPSFDQGSNLLYNHRITDGITVNLTGLNGLLHKFGYADLDDFYASSGSIGVDIQISIICPVGCGRNCGA